MFLLSISFKKKSKQKPRRDAQIKTTCFGLRVNENIFFAKPLRFGDVYYSSKCPAEADTSIF